MTIRALIVEDEPVARQVLRDFIAEIDWIECVGEAPDGTAGLEMALRLAPDLLFLDVRMPGMSGLELLARLSYRVDVVFTTAFDRYAVAAFELGALDYLVKPFSRARFSKTLARLRARAGDAPPRRHAFRTSSAPLPRLFARRGYELVPVRVRDIIEHVTSLVTEGERRVVIRLRNGTSVDASRQGTRRLLDAFRP